MLNREETAFLAQILQAKFGDKLVVPNKVRRKLLHGIVEYFQLQLEGFGSLKSLPIMLEIFAE